MIFPAELPPMQIAAFFFSQNALENSTDEQTIGSLQYHKLNYHCIKQVSHITQALWISKDMS